MHVHAEQSQITDRFDRREYRLTARIEVHPKCATTNLRRLTTVLKRSRYILFFWLLVRNVFFVGRRVAIHIRNHIYAVIRAGIASIHESIHEKKVKLIFVEQLFWIIKLLQVFYVRSE